MEVWYVGTVEFLKGETILEGIFVDMLYSPPQLDCLQFHAVLECACAYNIDLGSFLKQDFFQFDAILET